IALRRTNQGYQVYDALAESFRDEQQTGITAITDNPQAMGGINYILNTYLPDTYGTEAFTGAILAGQSIDATGQVLVSLIENGVVRTMPRQEQFAVVGASPEVVSILVSAIRTISDDRTLVAIRDLLDSILLNPKS
ncbi:hypothetical protein RZS08_30000, partial [Arthrospira platensis SPKY1]|nr:hypothetical protein [Arthrospira platensis SPKY1]